MGTPEFPDLGQHCHLPDCHLIDFLPFTCDRCHQVFCLEHRSYSSHQCSNADAQDVTVLVCPVCAKAVRLVPNEDPNLTWDQHVRTDCDPSNYAKVNKKPRCPVPGCREVLTFSNKVLCRDCKREVCLKHRFGQDHQCKAQKRVEKKESSFAGTFVKSFREKAFIGSGQSPGGSSSSSADAVRSGLQSAASTLRSSAEVGITKFNTLTNSMLNAVTGKTNKGQVQEHRAVPKAAKAPVSSQSERCPQCGAQFITVAHLIEHVESAHSRDRSGSNQQMLDVCPKCGRGFRDPISLVNHVERDHGGTSTEPLEQQTRGR